MRMKLLFVPVVLMSALIIADGKPTVEPANVWPTQWTTAPAGLSLNGKMFTLARFSSGVTLYHPYFSISSLSLTPKTQREKSSGPIIATRRPYTTPSYPPWTTAAPTRGVSVCLRFMIDYLDEKRPTIFTLSPSSRFLSLGVNDPTSYEVKYYSSTIVKLQPNIRIWPGLPPSAWTSVCLTIDSNKRVIQLFDGPFMSIRKVMSSQYDWSGEPVMQFSGTAGQVKDVQVWNYPLRYKDVYNYMTESSYWSKQGNILSWSHISYSVQGQSFLEDSYEATRSVMRESQLNRAAMSRELLVVGKTKAAKKEMA